MGTHIVTIPSYEMDAAMELKWDELQAVRFHYQDKAPFQLPLEDSHPFFAEEIVRFMPKKRMVAFGTWNEKPVVAKIFFSPRHGRKHMEKDLAGIETLKKNKIPTPALLYKGISEDRGAYVLVFARILDADSLEAIWLGRQDNESVWPVLRSVTLEIATQHVLGVLQHDIHLKNFLVAKRRVYTLDGAQIELFPHLLPKKQSMDNLALFLSQLGVGVEDLQERLFRYYAKSRGWLLKKEDLLEIFFLIKKWQERRWLRFEKKIFRDSTSFGVIQDAGSYAVYERQYIKPELTAFLRDPERVFARTGIELVKAGRSSTVIKVNLDGRDYVIKRYNMKSPWHFLRRCLRPTRAQHSWRLAHKLDLFGVRTAKPVAFIEARFLGLRGKSYYVTEYVSGEHAGEYLAQYRFKEDKLDGMVIRITALLKSLYKLDLTHGDLKATNILINENEQPVFIDLDGAEEHSSLSSLRRAWRKEIKRFLENFKDLPTLREKFQSALLGD